MEGKRHRFIWWILAVIILAVIIWYATAGNPSEEYKDGTFVWNPSHVFCINNRNYCSLNMSARSGTGYDERGGAICQRPFI